MKKIVYGGHWTEVPEGWLDIPESMQDLTAPLKQPDNHVDVIFTEHVLEHITLTDAILFFRNAHRVLKPGGILRIVCPMIEVMAANIVMNKERERKLYNEYFKNSLNPYYPSQLAALEEIGVDPSTHWEPFLIDSLIKNHQHKFVWSTALMVNVLERIGFSDVTSPAIGKSFFDQSNCLERRHRGVSPSTAMEAKFQIWDCESGVVEARK